MNNEELKEKPNSNLEKISPNENIKKTFKVKEIKRLNKEKENSNSKIIYGLGALALTATAFIVIFLDSRNLPEGEIISKVYSFLQVLFASTGVHIMGMLLKETINKCKIKGVIEYLENIDKINEKENLDKNFEEDMKRS